MKFKPITEEEADAAWVRARVVTPITSNARNKREHRLIYICSPYTPRGDDPCPESHQNVKKAIDAGIAALHKGWVPVIPHLYHHVHLEHPHPYETWMTVGSSLLEKCDALLVVEPQDLTSGMKREIDQATKQGTRILWGLGSL